MKIDGDAQTATARKTTTCGLESLSIRRKLLRLTSIVAILATWTLAVITLLAQPILGSAPTKTLDPKELDDFIETQLGQKPFVGISVALVQGGKMTFCKGYGYASKETKKPVDTETRFAVASVTKEFTAASIFLLLEEGKLSVYDPVAKYFPDLTRAQDIRLLDLMNMVSGYRDFYPNDFLTTEMTKPTTPDEVIDEYAKRPLDFEPGTWWSYSNTNYSILGRVVEKVSGKSYQDFVQECIFTPLGMTHSGFEPDPAGPEAAQGYRSFTVADPEPAPREGLNWMYSAGSIYTTPADMVKWDVALMNGKILKPESYRLMTTNRLLSSGAATSYCCGLGRKEVKGEAVFWHNGDAAGFLSVTEFLPSTQSALFITANTDSVALDDLVEHMEPLLLPADRRSPVPKIDGPEPVAVAKQLFAAFQQGKIDRTLLGSDFNAYLTLEKLDLASSSFKKLGEVKSVELVITRERGGMAHNTLDFKFEKVEYLCDLYRTPDGIVQEFLMSAK
jgi:D-alanyl-D-alanine carboxypeptidase